MRMPNPTPGIQAGILKSPYSSTPSVHKALIQNVQNAVIAVSFLHADS